MRKLEEVSSVTLVTFAVLTGLSMVAHSESAWHWGGLLILNYYAHLYIQHFGR